MKTANAKRIKALKNEWKHIKPAIVSRLADFRQLFESAREDRIFSELAFCLFTPQSKARHCWQAVQSLEQKGLLHKNVPGKIAAEINKVRFRNNKARYLVKARKQFLRGNKLNIKPLIKSFNSVFDAREWLARNVKGLGYKEASHFLRNIGLGRDLAILDRHILKNMKLLGVIREIPKTLTRNRYLEIESKLRKFSERTEIPLDHLDLLFWQRETGEIFK
ncbi:MAG: N-glycosylase/DNA lyase [Elusimicrobiota bacterium]